MSAGKMQLSGNPDIQGGFIISHKLKTGLKVAFIFCLVILSGCAPVIPQKTLDIVDHRIQFDDVRGDPEKYNGSIVLLGGVIVAVENQDKETVIEVMQQPLNSSLRPIKPGASAGRFLAGFTGFKDPAIYAPGRLITIVGMVKGSQVRPLGMMAYRYPVIGVAEDYLWRAREDSNTTFSIGLGFVGGR